VSTTDTFTVGKGMKPQGIAPSIALVQPMYARNVSMVMRSAAALGIKQVWYTGNSVDIEEPVNNVEFPIDEAKSVGKKKNRLPREERFKGYKEVELRQFDYFFEHFPDAVPVAVERRPNSVPLHLFDHPENALYVFGPENGSLQRVHLQHCHHFVVIPTRYCLNLSQAVTAVLWDREFKRIMDGGDPLTASELDRMKT